MLHLIKLHTVSHVLYLAVHTSTEMKYAVLIEPSVIPCAVHPLRISPVEWIECKCRSCPLRIIIIAQRQDWSTYAYLALFSDSRLISMLIYQKNL